MDKLTMNELSFTKDDIMDLMSDDQGKDFIDAFSIAQSILEDPDKFTDHLALETATRLSVHRMNLMVAVQLFKGRTKANLTPDDYIRKNLLEAISHGLEEVINVLKLRVRTGLRY